MKKLIKKIGLLALFVVYIGFVVKNILYYLILERTLLEFKGTLPFGTNIVYRLSHYINSYYWAYIVVFLLSIVTIEKMINSDKVKERIYIGILLVLILFEIFMLMAYPMIYK